MLRFCRSFAVFMVLVFMTVALSACGGSNNKPAPLVKKNSDLNGKTMAVFISEFAYDPDEYTSITNGLRDSGAKVIIISTTKRLIDAIEGYTFIDEADVNTIDAMLFIGGEGVYKYWNQKWVQDFVKKYGATGKFIGAISEGTTLLADAGVIKGKKVTGPADSKKMIEDSGATYTGKPVEADGNLVTAVKGKEKEFLQKVISLLKPAK